MVAHLLNQSETTNIGIENKRQICTSASKNKKCKEVKLSSDNIQIINSAQSIFIQLAILQFNAYSKFTSWIQLCEVLWADDWLCCTRLVHSTLHHTTLLPLCGAQSVVASGPEGPVQVLISGWQVGEDGSILTPGHGNLLWVETVHVAVKGDRDVVGLRWQGWKSNRRGIWEDRPSHT